MNRKYLLIASLLVIIISAALLISGSRWLLTPVMEDPYLPAGTFITWALMIAIPLSIYTGFQNRWNSGSIIHKWLGIALLALIVLGVLWAPICYGLAGNMNFSFTEKTTFQGGQTAMKMFWYFNGALVILPLISLILLAIFRK